MQSERFFFAGVIRSSIPFHHRPERPAQRVAHHDFLRIAQIFQRQVAFACVPVRIFEQDRTHDARQYARTQWRRVPAILQTDEYIAAAAFGDAAILIDKQLIEAAALFGLLPGAVIGLARCGFVGDEEIAAVRIFLGDE